VVRLRKTLRWFDNRPLFGKGILVTRAADQAGEFSTLLRDKGATVYECPTISIVPPDDSADLDAAIAALPDFDWLILTSVNAVKHFFLRLAACNRDSRALGRCRVCAVGPKTAAAIREYGIIPDLVPTDYKAEGVVAAFRELDMAGKKVLFPRADRAREVIPAELAKMGAEVVAPVAYRNVLPDGVPAEILEAMEAKRIHCATFTSSSTVQNLATLVGENRLLHLLDGVTIAAIGPVTAASCRELGLEVHIEPEKYTLEAMTEAITHYFFR
jgi:uroporphyrinogen III methyltransferase/synthase